MRLNHQALTLCADIYLAWHAAHFMTGDIDWCTKFFCHVLSDKLPTADTHEYVRHSFITPVIWCSISELIHCVSGSTSKLCLATDSMAHVAVYCAGTLNSHS